MMIDDDMVPMVDNPVADLEVNDPVVDPVVDDPASEDQFLDVLGDEDKNHTTCFESDYNGGDMRGMMGWKLMFVFIAGKTDG